MGLIETLLNRPQLTKEGTCETCAHLVQISDTALGCLSHDKLIMPDFPPYFKGGQKCKDWGEG